MNNQQPYTSAERNPDGTVVICVNWLDPSSDLARFTLECLQRGPYEETHRKVNFRGQIMILKCSNHREN